MSSKGSIANLSIGAKITLSFSAMFVAFVGLGGFALSRMNAMNTQAATIRDNYMPSIVKENALVLSLEQFRIAEARHIMSTDSKDMRAVEQEFSASMADYDKHRAEFESLIDPGEEQERFKEIDSVLAAYRTLHDKVVAASQKNENETAASLFKGEGKQTFRKLSDLYVADTAYNSAQGVNAANEAEQAYHSAFIWVVVAIAVLAAACATTGLALVRSISKPVSVMTAAMRRLASKDMTADIPGRMRGDEIGAMAGAVQVFKDNMVLADRLATEAEAAAHHRQAAEQKIASERAEAARLQSDVVQSIATGLDKLAEGDLVFRLEQAFAPEYETLRADFNGAISKLQDTMVVISAATSAIQSGTVEISTASNDLSRRTEQQAASLEETAAALDEITATVKKTSEGSIHARTVVASAKTDAEYSGEVVGRAVGAMSAIEASAQKVSQIIGVIDEIAFQTNLLALNAGVEAARAGEAGRGFAVVASEVRALAQRSAEAAKEIKALISTSSQQVSAGVDLVNETGTALQRIVRQVAEINAVVSDIATSTQEQATALHQVNTAINQMDQVTQQNAAMVEESTAASHALSKETDELSRLIARFQTGGETAGEPRSVVRSKAKPSRPVPVAAALKTGGRGGAALKPQTSVAEESWQEF